jgi:hypothetical protein
VVGGSTCFLRLQSFLFEASCRALKSGHAVLNMDGWVIEVGFKCALIVMEF